MYIYLTLLAILLSILYLLYAPSENDGGDATMFIKVNDPNKTTEKKKTKPKKFDSTTCNIYTCEGKQILIMYGTAYGFAERLAKKLYIRMKLELNSKEQSNDSRNEITATTQNTFYQPRLVNMKDYSEYIDLLQESCVLFIVSTAGDGVSPSDARSFMDYIQDEARGKSPLNHIHYSVLALGDSNYPYFCQCGKSLYERMSTLGASTKSIAPLQCIDREDHECIEKWFTEVIYNLSLYSHTLIPTKIDYLADRSPSSMSSSNDPSSRYHRNSPYNATTLNKRLLTTIVDPTYDKEIIHVDIDLGDSQLTYTEGDALGIVPYNNIIHVNTICQAFKLTENESHNLLINVNDNDISLSDALLQHYDLRVITKELIGWLITLYQQAKHVKPSMSVDYDELTNMRENLEKYKNQKEVIDVVERYITSSLLEQHIKKHDSATWYQDFCDTLKPLQPRYYSISSSPLLKNPQNQNIVSITAGVIRYNISHRRGEGVCTTYLSDRVQVGDHVKVFISVNTDFRLPVDSSKPIIMIGPGTGIAPFRAFIQNRIHTQSTGPNLLYFGCRSKHRDYTYSDELEGYMKNQQIQLRVAFSRDQAQKIYVQDLLLEDSSMIWKYIQRGAHLYVCGDGSHMAKDVHNVLLKIVEQHTGVNREQAETYLQKLTREHRYEKDVWIT